MSTENNYLGLYKLAHNLPPYQPTSKWCANAHYKNDEFFLKKESIKFVPDNILITKREFIRDNF
jgi:hypothetical protein